MVFAVVTIIYCYLVIKKYDYPYIKKVTFKKLYSNNIIKTLCFPFFIDNHIFNYYFEIYLPKDFKISMETYKNILKKQYFTINLYCDIKIP